eukprot:3925745-Rhodomonas_salina.8
MSGTEHGATRCAVLIQRMVLPGAHPSSVVSALDQYRPELYRPLGREVLHSAFVLCPFYRALCTGLWAYACATGCPVLSWGMLLPDRWTMRYGEARYTICTAQSCSWRGAGSQVRYGLRAR